MHSNIGLVDRYVRLTSGLVAFGAGLGMRRGHALAKAALLSFGAMKIAEGITGFCPLMYAAGVKSLPTRTLQTGSFGSADKTAPAEAGQDLEAPAGTLSAKTETGANRLAAKTSGESWGRSGASEQVAHVSSAAHTGSGHKKAKKGSASRDTQRTSAGAASEDTTGDDREVHTVH